MNLFDTHCHIDFHQYNDDRHKMLERARQAGVRRMLIPGVDGESIKRARRLAHEEAGIHVAVGIHPNSTAHWNTYADLRNLREWAKDEKTVAIGEIGLDYHWDRSPKDVQRKAFEDQLALAEELRLPVIIHNRDASEDTLPILESWVKTLPPELKERPGVLHSFSAPQVFAERALAIGFYLGFTGPVTYKTADDLRRVAAMVPDSRILIETDAPFLTPHPHRGGRNEPAFVALVAERIAALRQMPTEAFADLTLANGLRLFAISPQS
jgi:TatD DNase family protein